MRCSKKRYDKARAKAVALADRERVKELIHSYLCGECGWWHVGHASMVEQRNWEAERKKRLAAGIIGTAKQRRKARRAAIMADKNDRS
jgi:hypothetical protein